MFEICNVQVPEGCKKEISLEVTKTLDGQAMIIPFTVINGAKPGPVLLLDGCVHGDEPEGAMAIIRMINELDPAKLTGTVIAVPAVNVAALAQTKRGNARDEHNYDMNRIYPGRPDTFLTGRVAYKHFTEILQKATLEISIHGGGNHSFMCPAIFNSGIPESVELAKAMGEDWNIIMTSLGDASPAGQGKKLGIPGITVEIGGASGTVPEIYDQTVKTLMKGFYNVMYTYGMLEGTPTKCEKWWYGHQETVYVESDGLLNPIYGSTIGKMLQPGDPIAQVVNLRGEVVQEAVAPCVGIPFGVHSYPSVTTGDWLVFFAAGEWRTDL